MSASRLKGSLLEYIVRRLLLNCGFTRVRADGILIFSQSGLTMINGKGAAHDADVLMNPPIQMPFSYPYRLNFECKAYNKKADLAVIRNALGLRYDINEFEIVTKQQLISRQNNRRLSLAIDNRQRFNYQVGVASVEGFSKPAFEFAANNKIPLLSLRWFLPTHVCDMFHKITDSYVNQFTKKDISDLISFLKGEKNNRGSYFIENKKSIFKTIYDAFLEFENKVLIGLLESGDLLFLFDENNNALEYISGNQVSLKAQIHYRTRQIDYWSLSINNIVEFGFYLPSNIMMMWKNQNFEQQAAVDIKSQMFSKVFIFTKDDEIPFRILNIDRRWLDDLSSDEPENT